MELKSYRKQMQECKETGNLFEVEIPSRLDSVALVCAKYKCHCHSKVCYVERLRMARSVKFEYVVEGNHPIFRYIDRKCLSLKEAENVKDGLEAIGYEVEIIEL